ncbi:MAG: type III-B CRISPR module RAMP protein Cmr4 [Chloroflexaceae bacterium]|nr:type III-B CRISPR module RAMP protein Cmr4 [Chloroflexaceae bacterium]
MKPYECHRYLLMTTDPVHIGTGGYRLGRVDNSIVREPGTRIPKIPGTSLHGAARSYAARLYETPGAAGQTHDEIKQPATNPVCYTFGYLQKEEQNSDGKEERKGYSGVVNVSDAAVLLFPVHSMYGPVWVSTRHRLEDAGFTLGNNPPGEPPVDQVWCTWERTEALNLGWLMLNTAGHGKVEITPPGNKSAMQRWEAIKERIVVVHPSLFSHVVNSNLEVRTSVSIDPERGAAKERALFTYEALPRATFLTMDVIVDDYRGTFPSTTTTDRNNPIPGGQEWQNAMDVVDAGLRMIEWLGVGGMGTRGFGRLAVVGTWEVQ